MSLREAAKAILESVEGEMSSAYNRARAVCCGRGIDECCGSPEPEWDEADQLVMDTLAPVQRALRAALAEAEAPKAETVATTPEPAALSDEEIIRMFQEHAFWPMPEIKDVVAFARAVLAQGGKG